MNNNLPIGPVVGGTEGTTTSSNHSTTTTDSNTPTDTEDNSPVIEIDPKFEFRAPKYFDFALLADDNYSLHASALNLSTNASFLQGDSFFGT